MRTNLTLHSIAKPLFGCLLAAILMSTLINAAIAQPDPGAAGTQPGGTTNPPPDGATKPQPGEKPLKVIAVRGKIKLYRHITVQIEGLDDWARDPAHDYSKFILYIDGNAFDGLVPGLVSTTIDGENRQVLRFDLEHIIDDEKKKDALEDAWTAVLSRYKRHEREVSVTVRHPNVAVEGDATATLIVIDKFWFYVFMAIFVSGLVLFYQLARRSDIIRDPGPQPGPDENGNPRRKPYSLARTQMALWFFTIIISYVFIWLVTSDLASLTASVLGLMGISAGTGLGSAVVDSGKVSDQQNQLQALEEKRKSDEVEVEKLKKEISALNESVNATPPPANAEEQKASLASSQSELTAKQKEIEQTSQKIERLAAAAKPEASKRFMLDILSDDNGVSFHRFQIFGWTLVLICIFIAQVYQVLTMPDFDATLLGLMGISSGTYIGFKIPNQQG